jgi:para-nitrobenzyl esterase
LEENVLHRNSRKVLPILAAGCLSLIAAAAATPALAGTRVTTKYGVVEGFTRSGLDDFLGIPFAAPPSGDLRWRPPQPPAKWSGVLKATAFGNICPQLEIYDGFNLPSTTEDCLYLNVFTPAGASTAGQKLPVMFWIYGGGFAGGESNDYNPSKLAKEGNVIVVTINYRVGVLGIFAHPALTAEHHLVTNYGLMDQQSALRWVHDNIGGFGGDPSKVTIFGESAGGVSVYTQLASPLVRGMFSDAIVESGAFAGLLKNTTEADAEVSGEKFAAQVGCVTQTAACLRAVPVTTILNDQASYPTQPVVDGKLLPLPFDTAFSTGQFNRVPVINGTNQDELRWSVAFGYDLTTGPATAADYENYLLSAFGTNARTVAAKYPLSSYQSPDVALATVETDSGVACSSSVVDGWLSQFTQTYAYEFDDPSPPIYLPPVSFPTGAAHTTELQFLWPGYHGGEGIAHPLSPREEVLSTRMVKYWTTFAKAGRPSYSVPSYWPHFTIENPNIQFLLLANPVPSHRFSQEHNCGFWNKLLGWPANL